MFDIADFLIGILAMLARMVVGVIGLVAAVVASGHRRLFSPKRQKADAPPRQRAMTS